MNNKLLPIILQHVRQLAELQMSGLSGDRYKLITPFPPELNDFPDFTKGGMQFTDPENEVEAKKDDIWNAYEFFRATDNLFYDYSYGIKSPDYYVSHVCKKFFLDALLAESAEINFDETFKQKRAAFLERFPRSTIGDIGQVDFYYTFPSAIQWSSGKIILAEKEVKQLREKALSVYESIEGNDTGYLKELISEIKTVDYSSIQYDLGFFDVIREWLEPELFENGSWKFKNTTETLYGENDDNFKSNDVKLCYSQRFYVVKDWTGTVKIAPAKEVIRPRVSIEVRDHRTVLRNVLLNKILLRPKVTVLSSAQSGKYIWVKDHWERKRATIVTAIKEEEITTGSLYKVAAIKCRIIPWKPNNNH